MGQGGVASTSSLRPQSRSTLRLVAGAPAVTFFASEALTVHQSASALPRQAWETVPRFGPGPSSPAERISILGFRCCCGGFWGWFVVRAVGDEGILYICSKAVCFLTTRPVVRLVG